jgi:hypothetical protein
VNPAFFTDEELARYASLYGADELPKTWVAELLKRFLKLVDDKYDASHV